MCVASSHAAGSDKQLAVTNPSLSTISLHRSASSSVPRKSEDPSRHGSPDAWSSRELWMLYWMAGLSTAAVAAGLLAAWRFQVMLDAQRARIEGRRG